MVDESGSSGDCLEFVQQLRQNRRTMVSGSHGLEVWTIGNKLPPHGRTLRKLYDHFNMQGRRLYNPEVQEPEFCRAV